MTERWHLADNGQALQVDFTVTDPKNFNQPWNATQKFRRTRGPIEEIICAENNRDAFTGIEYVDQPTDDTPDFYAGQQRSGVSSMRSPRSAVSS